MAEDHPQHELAIRVGSLHKSYRLGDRRVDALNPLVLVPIFAPNSLIPTA